MACARPTHLASCVHALPGNIPAGPGSMGSVMGMSLPTQGSRSGDVHMHAGPCFQPWLFHMMDNLGVVHSAVATQPWWCGVPRWCITMIEARYNGHNQARLHAYVYMLDHPQLMPAVNQPTRHASCYAVVMVCACGQRRQVRLTPCAIATQCSTKEWLFECSQPCC